MGLPSPDPRSLCPLSSTEFVEPPTENITGYATGIFSGVRQLVCVGERGRYTYGSLAAVRSPLSEVPDREIPKVEVGHGADILSS